MKYDLKYPLAKYLDEPEDGILHDKTLGLCHECKEKSHWVSIMFCVTICSDECNKLVWSNYANSFHREGVDEDEH